ncbi:Bd3614 family nucleic acid deaminase [Pseudoalteromonas luteoviolacea]|uniref:Bd3614 family nucleic acid deaminase n=1 Tax=Pseudoalteromonas luteoviolacea TaxID=43657 RepID=UPI0011524DAB|nr:Bd3614 family nucleic acid deaminase [Pseudoalteromonas luteoviolacea]TQF68054.1 hypothetical protein FLM44_23080 [Pseudoalteromonas luteoviolacea]
MDKTHLQVDTLENLQIDALEKAVSYALIGDASGKKNVKNWYVVYDENKQSAVSTVTRLIQWLNEKTGHKSLNPNQESRITEFSKSNDAKTIYTNESLTNPQLLGFCNHNSIKVEPLLYNKLINTLPIENLNRVESTRFSAMGLLKNHLQDVSWENASANIEERLLDAFAPAQDKITVVAAPKLSAAPDSNQELRNVYLTTALLLKEVRSWGKGFEWIPNGKSVAALIVDSTGCIKSWAVNTSNLNDTYHAEINAMQSYIARYGQPTNKGKLFLYSTHQPCDMCQGMIIQFGEGELKAYYANKDSTQGKKTAYKELNKVFKDNESCMCYQAVKSDSLQHPLNRKSQVFNSDAWQGEYEPLIEELKKQTDESAKVAAQYVLKIFDALRATKSVAG